MSENWDFYFKQVEDKPASMFVDLDAALSAPDAALPFMAYARVRMPNPREDGLSSQEDYETLLAIEDAFTAGLTGEGRATDYVGRCTTNGCRDFVFYLAQPEGWDARVAECMRAWPDYECETGTRAEPEWTTYFEYLYPGEADRQIIENRRVCDSLESHGDRLQEAREIDHWAHFADQAARDAYVAEAMQAGFAVRNLWGPDDQDDRYGADLWRSDIPAYNTIDDVTLPLFHLAAKHGGDYDGWECEVLN